VANWPLKEYDRSSKALTSFPPVSPSRIYVFIDLPDLAAERFGGAVVAANDEFFAPKDSLIKASAPEWREGVYTERGKWMDGWETRRRRTPGHDWAIIRLGLPGVVRGVVIDTSFFTGNFPEQASIDACAAGGVPSVVWLTSADAPWRPILAESALLGNTENQFAIASDVSNLPQQQRSSERRNRSQGDWRGTPRGRRRVERVRTRPLHPRTDPRKHHQPLFGRRQA